MDFIFYIFPSAVFFFLVCVGEGKWRKSGINERTNKQKMIMEISKMRMSESLAFVVERVAKGCIAAITWHSYLLDFIVVALTWES